MKKIIIFMLLASMLAGSMVALQNKQLQDGLYLVDEVLYTSNVTPQGNQMPVHFNKNFIENVPGGSWGLLINTADFVPLLLEAEPLLVSQKDAKTKLQLTFSRMTAAKLESFTGKNVMKEAAMIVNGEVITMHKIREAIRGGKMEITGSSDKAYQGISVVLKRNVVKGK